MKRQMFSWVLLACIATGALFLSGCSTVSSRIEANQAAFTQLSPQDQALVREGRIRGGMSQDAVYMAWGQPQQKVAGMVHDTATESWVYTASTSGYGYGYGPYYGPGWYGGWGFSGRVAFVGRRHGHRFFGAFYDPFWDPFYYPFPDTIQYPVKTVSFQNGRVVAFQYLAPGY